MNDDDESDEQSQTRVGQIAKAVRYKLIDDINATLDYTKITTKRFSIMGKGMVVNNNNNKPFDETATHRFKFLATFNTDELRSRKQVLESRKKNENNEGNRSEREFVFQFQDWDEESIMDDETCQTTTEAPTLTERLSHRLSTMISYVANNLNPNRTITNTTDSMVDSNDVINKCNEGVDDDNRETYITTRKRDYSIRDAIFGSKEMT